MAELFSVTAPLLLRCRDGREWVMVERFAHPDGLLFFELFWESGERGSGIHVMPGPIKGDGPWKVGDCVVTVLGCQGANPQLAGAYAGWQAQRQADDRDSYPCREDVIALAREHGALI